MTSPAPSQSRTASLAEACANVAIGYLLALLIQHLVYPLFGLHATMTAQGVLAAIFTLASLARSYLIRRFFEHLAELERRGQLQRAESLKRRFAGRP